MEIIKISLIPLLSDRLKFRQSLKCPPPTPPRSVETDPQGVFTASTTAFERIATARDVFQAANSFYHAGIYWKVMAINIAFTFWSNTRGHVLRFPLVRSGWTRTQIANHSFLSTTIGDLLSTLVLTMQDINSTDMRYAGLGRKTVPDAAV